MDNENNKTLTAEQEMQLRKPIEDYVGEIQEKIDSLRVDGSNRVVSLQSEIDAIKRDHGLTKEEKTAQTEEIKSEMLKAKAVEAASISLFSTFRLRVIAVFRLPSLSLVPELSLAITERFIDAV